MTGAKLMRKIVIYAGFGAVLATQAQAVTMAELDTDADGMASFDEVLAVMPDMSVETFNLVDLNQDGLIDADELATAQEAGIIPAS